MNRRLAVVVSLVALSLAALVSVASAEGPLTITRSEASYTFQKEARFVLEASSTSEISKATLRFRLGSQTSTNTYDKAFDPTLQLTLDHTWNLANTDLPSGIVVAYWWTVEDKAGNKAESQRRTFLYEDTSYTWKRISREDVTLAWYRGDDSLGRELLDSAVAAQQRLAVDFGVERQTAVIYIYGSFEDLRGGIGESAQEWTGGRAYPEFGVTLIGVPPNQLDSFGKRAVAHEFAHLIVHRATRNPFSGLPRWLDEGLAMWAEGELETSYRNDLSGAVRSGGLLSLRTLSSNFPADSRQASLAYAQSHSVVAYLRDAFGRQKIAELLAIFKEGSTDDSALTRAFGIDTEELDRRWRASLGVRVEPEQQTAPPPSAGFTSSDRLPQWTVIAIGLGILAGAAIIVICWALIVVIIARA